MELLDHRTYYRALQSHDARFDGHVFVGCTSTGIYCRQICPTRPPKFENSRFFASASTVHVARDDLRNDWNRTAPRSSSVGICVGTSGVSLTPKTEKNGPSDRQLDSAPAPFLLKAVAASPLPRRPRRPR